jgi:hypothetical protein
LTIVHTRRNLCFNFDMVLRSLRKCQFNRHFIPFALSENPPNADYPSPPSLDFPSEIVGRLWGNCARDGKGLPAGVGERDCFWTALVTCDGLGEILGRCRKRFMICGGGDLQIREIYELAYRFLAGISFSPQQYPVSVFLILE